MRSTQLATAPRCLACPLLLSACRIPHWQCRRRPVTRLHEGINDQQQSVLPEQPAATDQAAAAAPAATDLAATEGIPDAAAAEFSEASSESQHTSEVTVAPAAGNSTVTLLYFAMSGGLAAAGLLVSVYAAPIAASCLTLGSLPLQQAAVLVGCCGAALLRAASLAVFVAEGSAAGQLGTWRYQRINLGLAAAASFTALLQPLSFGCANPLALLVVTAVAAAAAAACVIIFLQQWRQDEGVQFASAVGSGDWMEDVQAGWVYFVRDATTLAGSVLLVLGAVAAAAFLQTLTSNSTVGVVPWAVQGVVEPGLQYMRKLLGVGLLLTALQCWALGECAGTARKLSPQTAVKLVLSMQIEAQQLQSGQLRAPAHLAPGWFNLLHIGFFAAAVVQGLWLAQAGVAAVGPGVATALNVNAADPVWPVLYWTVLGSAVYLVSLLASLDYTDVWSWIVGLGSYLSGWVSWVATILYVDWTWLTEVRRR